MSKHLRKDLAGATVVELGCGMWDEASRRFLCTLVVPCTNKIPLWSSCTFKVQCTLSSYAFVVAHIQRIGCHPEKTTLHGGQSRSWFAEQGKKEKKKESGSAPLPPPALLVFNILILIGENKIKIMRRIYMPRRYAGLGPSCVCTRIPSTHRLGQWVSLRKILKILRFRVR